MGSHYYEPNINIAKSIEACQQNLANELYKGDKKYEQSKLTELLHLQSQGEKWCSIMDLPMKQ